MFRVRSAQRIKISDADLIKRLVIIVLIFAAFLSGRTIAGRPRVVKGKFDNVIKTYQEPNEFLENLFKTKHVNIFQ